MKWASILLTVIECFVVADGVSAQRYLPGMRGLQFTAGIAPENGCFSGVAFSQYTKHADRWVFGAEYFEKRHPYENIHIPQSQFTAEGGYFLNFLSDPHKIIFVSIGASVLMGYETINWNKKLLFNGARVDNSDVFLYGGAITLECETYLTNRLVVLANVRERLLGGSSVGLLNTQLGIGLKFIIN